MLDSLKHYKAVIFDMDGTLIDTMPSHVAAWEKTALRFNVPFDADWIHSLGGMPSPKITLEINKRFGLNLDPTEVAGFKTKTFQAIENKGELIQHTYDILLSLKPHTPVAIGTGSVRTSAEALLKEKGVFELFDAIVTASDVTNHKPHPDTFLLAASKLKIPAHECAVFEDTLLGMQAAHAANMDCYLVTEGGIEFHPRQS